MTETTSTDESIADRVFEAAKRLLKERVREASESQAWVTGSEIAHVTDLDKEAVLAALGDLGSSRRLHIRSVTAASEIEVLGVDHGPGADSLEEPVDAG